MFFEKEVLSFNILDVLKIKQTNIHTFNRGRNFNALSFRSQSDAVLTTEMKEIHMPTHSMCYVPARLDYRRDCTIDEMIVVHFDTIDYRTNEIETFSPKEPDTLTKLFKEILDCWEKKEPAYRMECSALLYRIFAECYRQNERQEVKLSKIQPSVDFLHQNYKKNAISLKEIAAKSFISEVYFRKLFKEEYGISPQKYIIHLRIQNAKGLISTGYYSLKEVASLSGYPDYKYFSVEFKKALGISPSEYLYNYHTKQNSVAKK